MQTLSNSIENLSRNSIYIYLKKINVALLSSAIFIYISRNLSVGEYGVYSLFIAILTSFAFILPLGFPSSLLRFIPELIENKDFSNAAHITNKCFLIILVWGSLCLLFSNLMGSRIERLFNVANLYFYFPILTILGIIAAQISILDNVSSALFLQKYSAIYESSVTLIYFFLIVLLIKQGYGPFGILIAMVITQILLFLLYFNRVSKILFNKVSNIKEEFDFKRFIRFSFKEFLFRVTAIFWDVTLDIYIITYMLGSSAAGLFGFATYISLFFLNWLPGMALQDLIRPLFVKSYTKNRSEEELNRLFKLYNKFKAFFIFPIIVAMWLLIDKAILVIFQSKFMSAVNTLRVLFFFVMLQSFLRPLNNIFVLLERNEIAFYSNIVIFYRLLASLLLIKYFGIQGAAWAFGTSISLIFLIQYIWLKKIINVNLPYLDFLKIAFNSFVMGMVIFLLRSRITNLANLILIIILGAAIYMLMSYFNKSFKENERSILNSAIGVKVWGF